MHTLFLLQVVEPSIWQQIFHAVVGIVATSTAVFLAVQIAKAQAKIDALPDWVKLVVTPIIGFILSKASVLFQFPLPGNLGGFTADVVRGFIAAVGAFIEHKLFGQVITQALRNARKQLGR